jgi:uncharacterized protein YndB with AHSA1/START domain
MYIRAPAERVWTALTSEADTARFFFGRVIKSDWREGSPWTAYLPDGAGIDTIGVVLEADRPRRLVFTWHVQWIEEARALGESVIAYEIEPAGEDVVRLTVKEWLPPGAPRKFIEGGQQGWAIIMSSLKSLLETGEPIIVKMEPPQ